MYLFVAATQNLRQIKLCSETVNRIIRASLPQGYVDFIRPHLKKWPDRMILLHARIRFDIVAMLLRSSVRIARCSTIPPPPPRATLAGQFWGFAEASQSPFGFQDVGVRRISFPRLGSGPVFVPALCTLSRESHTFDFGRQTAVSCCFFAVWLGTKGRIPGPRGPRGIPTLSIKV